MHLASGCTKIANTHYKARDTIELVCEFIGSFTTNTEYNVIRSGMNTNHYQLQKMKR